MKINISSPRLVFAPEMTEAVSRWGVYAIPYMWRESGGELVVRFNGEEDSSDIENIQRAPNLYFISHDNGKTWEYCPDGDKIYSISVLTGIDPPYCRLKNGDTVFLKTVPDLPCITDTEYCGEFVTPCQDAVVRTYRWGDIAPECRKLLFGRIHGVDGDTEIFETLLDFPERQIQVVSKSNCNGNFVKVDEYVQPFIFRRPYFSAICETKDCLAAVGCGQNPNVTDKFYTEVYLVVSTDGGRTWKKRATVAGGVTDVPYGYGGDGAEVSLTVDKNGDMYCVMRMDLSSDPRKDPTNICDAMLCISRDGGFTWSKPRSVADSSVTPHIVSVGNALVLIYGRPGVHIKYSTDGGKTFSEPYSLIGKTLTEERNAGRDDFDSKYGHPCSYSNTFYERISEREILVLYNDLTYPDKNGRPTKAALVKVIEITED